MEPPGKQACRRSKASRPAASRPLTVEVRWRTCGKLSSARRDARKLMSRCILPASVSAASRRGDAAIGRAAGSAGAPIRRRNWDSGRQGRPRRSRGKTCIRRSRSGHRARRAASPDRSIRSSVSIPASSSRTDGSGRRASCARRLVLASGFRYEELPTSLQENKTWPQTRHRSA